MIQAGKLRDRVSVQSPTRSPNTYGETPQAWSDLAERWANVEPVTGKEITVGDQQQSQVTHRVQIRYDARVTADCRLIWEGRVLNVTAVMDPDGRKREMTLLCVEAGEP